MKKGFYDILAAQFFSSLADNALLIAAIALLQSIDAPEWMTPLLKLFFVVSYILLAAWVGIFADLLPKGRVMFLTNSVKILGCLMMLFGSHPLLAYAVVGIGAAAYSPAKYGILTELLPPSQLVIANGWIEGLTVVSIILGVVLGGVLVNPDVGAFLIEHGPLHLLGVHSVPGNAIGMVSLVYLIAALINLRIPDTGARYPHLSFQPVKSLVTFYRTCMLLWTDRLGQISLAVTTLFWGAGAVLQFVILRWADHALGMNLSQAAILQAVVSLGIAGGAVIAARRVPLEKSLSVLPLGAGMGLLVGAAAYFHQDMLPGVLSVGPWEIRWAVIFACVIMIAVGVLAGAFVVPMNALLQHRGYVLMSAGRSIAVQNFNENASILVMLGLYALLLKTELSIPLIMLLFGVFVAGSMGLVILRHRRNQREFDSTHLIGEEKRPEAF